MWLSWHYDFFINSVTVFKGNGFNSHANIVSLPILKILKKDRSVLSVVGAVSATFLFICTLTSTNRS